MICAGIRDILLWALVIGALAWVASVHSGSIKKPIQDFGTGAPLASREAPGTAEDAGR